MISIPYYGVMILLYASIAGASFAGFQFVRSYNKDQALMGFMSAFGVLVASIILPLLLWINYEKVNADSELVPMILTFVMPILAGCIFAVVFTLVTNLEQFLAENPKVAGLSVVFILLNLLQIFFP